MFSPNKALVFGTGNISFKIISPTTFDTTVRECSLGHSHKGYYYIVIIWLWPRLCNCSRLQSRKDMKFELPASIKNINNVKNKPNDHVYFCFFNDLNT